MAKQDIVTDRSVVTHSHSRTASRACDTTPEGTSARRVAEPLFKRFAVSRDWRTKDGAVG